MEEENGRRNGILSRPLRPDEVCGPTRVSASETKYFARCNAAKVRCRLVHTVHMGEQGYICDFVTGKHPYEGQKVEHNRVFNPIHPHNHVPAVCLFFFAKDLEEVRLNIRSESAC